MLTAIITIPYIVAKERPYNDLLLCSMVCDVAIVFLVLYFLKG